MAGLDSIPVGSDSPLTLRGLQNDLTNDFVNDATVTIVLRDEAGDQLGGMSWPQTMDYIADSDGDYQMTLSDTLDVEAGDLATATIEIDGDGLQATLTLPVRFVARDQFSLAWSSRKEIELLFGASNVSQWADLDNEEVAETITERIQWAVDEATAEARDQLRGGPVKLSAMIEAPRSLRTATTRLAGVMLYESRGVKDTSDESGKHRLSTHRELARKFFQEIAAGTRTLDTEMATSTPAVRTIHSPKDGPERWDRRPRSRQCGPFE